MAVNSLITLLGNVQGLTGDYRTGVVLSLPLLWSLCVKPTLLFC